MAYRGKMKSGGNLHSYLGHFAGADVLKAGHNEMPVIGAGQTDTIAQPSSTPVGRQFNVATPGGGGTFSGAKLGLGLNLNPRQRATYRADVVSGYGGGGQGLGKRAQMDLAQGMTGAAPVAGGVRAARQAARAPVVAARQNVQAAQKTGRTGVRTARQTLQAALKSPGGGRIRQARAGMQAARQAGTAGVMAARAGMRTARAGLPRGRRR